MPDDRRPLNPRGRRDARALGRSLGTAFAPIDLVVCSTAERARETLALTELAPPATVRYEERVYAATHEQLAGVLEELPDEVARVVLVGHNPGLSDLVRYLTAQPVELKTSSVAVLEWDGGWADVWSRNANLVAFDTPRG